MDEPTSEDSIDSFIDSTVSHQSITTKPILHHRISTYSEHAGSLDNWSTVVKECDKLAKFVESSKCICKAQDENIQGTTVGDGNVINHMY